jgi:ectoine hydroxylase-related dioxygenase (phytanoyl-CoA dioxygenase family)
MTGATHLHNDGYAVVPNVIDERTLRAIERCLRGLQVSRAGTRNLLQADWCRALARRLASSPTLAPLLPQRFVAVQCTLFDKSPDCNWSVPLHRDVHIPVAQRVDHPMLSGWSRKEGSWFVQAPLPVLRQAVALRVQVDDGVAGGGGLCVVPRSHRAASKGAAHDCVVGRGDVLAMSPLLLHASAKAARPVRRRVLHFLFAPGELPFGLRWPTPN